MTVLTSDHVVTDFVKGTLKENPRVAKQLRFQEKKSKLQGLRKSWLMKKLRAYVFKCGAICIHEPHCRW